MIDRFFELHIKHYFSVLFLQSYINKKTILRYHSRHHTPHNRLKYNLIKEKGPRNPISRAIQMHIKPKIRNDSLALVRCSNGLPLGSNNHLLGREVIKETSRRPIKVKVDITSEFILGCFEMLQFNTLASHYITFSKEGAGGGWFKRCHRMLTACRLYVVLGCRVMGW
jgi:hypothetical protein